jgi:hypothetical protein
MAVGVVHSGAGIRIGVGGDIGHAAVRAALQEGSPARLGLDAAAARTGAVPGSLAGARVLSGLRLASCNRPRSHRARRPATRRRSRRLAIRIRGDFLDARTTHAGGGAGRGAAARSRSRGELGEQPCLLPGRLPGGRSRRCSLSRRRTARSCLSRRARTTSAICRSPRATLQATPTSSPLLRRQGVLGRDEL